MVFSFLEGRKDRQSVPLAQFRGLSEVRAYWEGLRRDGGLPTRANLDPRGMANVLEHVFVAEKIGRGLGRLRIAGSALADLCGMEMKGLPLSVLMVPEARLRLADVLERVFSDPQAAELHLEAETSIGRPALLARLLLLPLHSDGPAARELVLGCLATEGEVGRAPRRFGISRVVQERLALTAAPTAQPDTPFKPQMAFAEDPSVMERPEAGSAYLRLVYSAE